MFKKTITFTNFNGEKITKDFYFHLSKAELVRMGADSTMEERLNRMISAKDNVAIMQEFEQLIRLAVGIRSEDGNSFIKSPEAQAQFMFSPAYDELLVELVTNADAAVDFVQQLLPEKMQKELREQMGIKSDTTAETDNRPGPQMPDWIREQREPSLVELRNATPEQMQMAFRLKLKPGN